ncbi:hypothetical protein BU14_0109s0025 [Porphyra umbilicalis]|uniref:Uncharacterized protein n=1 Tax=Porphyra umbilicalis TaxID=2786 RepID=A0A1X6PCI0_PORUM|nr:hypothetical protein BU14_0109s0025 [Porphyra umbilicalis]|eukprot:OSX78425.1 hypothetical protein BU14_0109s0025 [Porphyra umbilicalis]
MYGKNHAGRHFHFNTQSRFLTIPDITLSSASTPSTSSRSAAPSPRMSTTPSTPATPPSSPPSPPSSSPTPPTDPTTATSSSRASPPAPTTPASTATPALTPPPSPRSAVPPALLPTARPQGLHSLAAKLLWVGRVARPDVLTNATHLAKLPNPTGADARRANDTLAAIARHPISLHYPPLDPASLCLDVYADYSGSATSPLDRRQLGYLIALVDASRRFSLLHWASHRPHRVCRGSCAGELLALADAVAAALDVRLLLQGSSPAGSPSPRTRIPPPPTTWSRPSRTRRT